MSSSVRRAIITCPICLRRANRDGRAIETEFPLQDKFNSLAPPQPAAIRARGIASFVTVQEGCDKFCTFCVVPYTRGAEVSRPVAKIADDVRRLADNGVREITLIGQNVNAFHGDGPDGKPWPLGKLLHHLAEIDGIARLRYTTSHPCDVDDSLVAAHRDLPALMPYLHLPVQSGSDRILGAMNRKHTVAEYHRIIEKFRAARGRHGVFVGFHRRISRRKPMRISPRPSRWSSKSVTLRPIRSSIRRGRARPRRRCRG